ncbi:MAG: hypothetical protein WA977_13550 [Halobacteriota archaeon]
MRSVPRFSHRSPHAAFSTGAFCKVQLILRRCGSGSEAAELECEERNAARSSAWQALH